MRATRSNSKNEAGQRPSEEALKMPTDPSGTAQTPSRTLSQRAASTSAARALATTAKAPTTSSKTTLTASSKTTLSTSVKAARSVKTTQSMGTPSLATAARATRLRTQTPSFASTVATAGTNTRKKQSSLVGTSATKPSVKSVVAKAAATTKAAATPKVETPKVETTKVATPKPAKTSAQDTPRARRAAARNASTFTRALARSQSTPTISNASARSRRVKHEDFVTAAETDFEDVPEIEMSNIVTAADETSMAMNADTPKAKANVDLVVVDTPRAKRIVSDQQLSDTPKAKVPPSNLHASPSNTPKPSKPQRPKSQRMQRAKSAPVELSVDTPAKRTRRQLKLLAEQDESEDIDGRDDEIRANVPDEDSKKEEVGVQEVEKTDSDREEDGDVEMKDDSELTLPIATREDKGKAREDVVADNDMILEESVVETKDDRNQTNDNAMTVSQQHESEPLYPSLPNLKRSASEEDNHSSADTLQAHQYPTSPAQQAKRRRTGDGWVSEAKSVIQEVVETISFIRDDDEDEVEEGKTLDEIRDEIMMEEDEDEIVTEVDGVVKETEDQVINGDVLEFEDAIQGEESHELLLEREEMVSPDELSHDSESDHDRETKMATPTLFSSPTHKFKTPSPSRSRSSKNVSPHKVDAVEPQEEGDILGKATREHEPRQRIGNIPDKGDEVEEIEVRRSPRRKVNEGETQSLVKDMPKMKEKIQVSGTPSGTPNKSKDDELKTPKDQTPEQVTGTRKSPRRTPSAGIAELMKEQQQTLVTETPKTPRREVVATRRSPRRTPIAAMETTKDEDQTAVAPKTPAREAVVGTRKSPRRTPSVHAETAKDETSATFGTPTTPQKELVVGTRRSPRRTPSAVIETTTAPGTPGKESIVATKLSPRRVPAANAEVSKDDATFVKAPKTPKREPVVGVRRSPRRTPSANVEATQTEVDEPPVLSRTRTPSPAKTSPQMKREHGDEEQAQKEQTAKTKAVADSPKKEQGTHVEDMDTDKTEESAAAEQTGTDVVQKSESPMMGVQKGAAGEISRSEELVPEAIEKDMTPSQDTPTDTMGLDVADKIDETGSTPTDMEMDVVEEPRLESKQTDVSGEANVEPSEGVSTHEELIEQEERESHVETIVPGDVQQPVEEEHEDADVEMKESGLDDESDATQEDDSQDDSELDSRVEEDSHEDSELDSHAEGAPMTQPETIVLDDSTPSERTRSSSEDSEESVPQVVTRSISKPQDQESANAELEVSEDNQEESEELSLSVHNALAESESADDRNHEDVVNAAATVLEEMKQESDEERKTERMQSIAKGVKTNYALRMTHPITSSSGDSEVEIRITDPDDEDESSVHSEDIFSSELDDDTEEHEDERSRHTSESIEETDGEEDPESGEDEYESDEAEDIDSEEYEEDSEVEEVPLSFALGRRNKPQDNEVICLDSDSEDEPIEIKKPLAQAPAIKDSPLSIFNVKSLSQTALARSKAESQTAQLIAKETPTKKSIEPSYAFTFGKMSPKPTLPKTLNSINASSTQNVAPKSSNVPFPGLTTTPILASRTTQPVSKPPSTTKEHMPSPAIVQRPSYLSRRRKNAASTSLALAASNGTNVGMNSEQRGTTSQPKYLNRILVGRVMKGAGSRGMTLMAAHDRNRQLENLRKKLRDFLPAFSEAKQKGYRGSEEDYVDFRQYFVNVTSELQKDLVMLKEKNQNQQIERPRRRITEASDVKIKRDDSWLKEFWSKTKIPGVSSTVSWIEEPHTPRFKQIRDRELAIDKEMDRLLGRDSFPPLPPNAEQRISKAMNAGPDTVVKTIGKIELKSDDMRRLRPGTWLNDEIMNSYGELLMQRAKNTPNYPRIHYLNSFFFTYLSQGYDRVKKWSRRFPLWELDKLVFPVHVGENHWCLGVINFMDKRIEYYDSLGGSHPRFFMRISEYLIEEAKKANKSDFNLDDWTEYCPSNVPHQENGSDCGVFTLTFAEYCSRNAPFDFDQSKMPYIRKRIAIELLDGKLTMGGPTSKL